MCPASAPIDLSRGTPSCTSTAHLTMVSAMSFNCGVKVVTSNSRIDLAVFCIWSIELSIDVIRSRMLPPIEWTWNGSAPQPWRSTPRA